MRRKACAQPRGKRDRWIGRRSGTNTEEYVAGTIEGFGIGLGFAGFPEFGIPIDLAGGLIFAPSVGQSTWSPSAGWATQPKRNRG